MFDQNTLAQLEAGYRPPAQKEKPSGVRGMLIKALPTIGGAAGNVLGAFAGRNAGAARLGGAAGSGLGEFLRQKLMGEEANIGTIARESAFGAIPGAAGVIKSAKAARGAKGAVEAAEQTAKTAPQSTEAVMQARKSAIQGTRDNAKTASQEGFGVKVGDNAGRGRVVTPDQADELSAFINQGSQKYGGIRPGKPINQAKDAQNVYNNVTRSLDDTLTKIDRPLQPTEPGAISASIFSKIKENPAITKGTPTAEKFAAKIQNAKNLKELEAIRREADDLAFTSTGAGKTSAAAQSHAVRDAIDEFITPLSPGYKAVKGDYTLARDALQSTSKASKNAKGVPVPLTGGQVEFGRQSVSGMKNKVNAKLSGGEVPASGDTPSFRPYWNTTKAAFPQAGYRAVGSAVFGTPFVGTGQPPEQEPETNLAEQLGITTAPQQVIPEEATQQTPDIQAAIQQILASGGTMKDAADYLALMQGMQEFGASKEKPLSAEAAKVVSTANSGLSSLGQIESIIQQSGVPSGTVIPGRGLVGGLGQNLLGTSSYDAAADNVADAMVRARTGAAATKEELALYRRLLPQAFDSPEVQQQKMQTVRDYFTSIANRTGSAGTDTQ